MKRNKLLKWALIIIVCAAQPVFAESANEAFAKIADTYFDTVLLPANPSEAVQLGYHQYDNNLEPYSEHAIKTFISQLQGFAKIVESVNPAQLDVQTQGDRELVLNNIRGELLTLQNIRPYENNPDYYSSGITNDAFVLISRNFAAPDIRLRSLIAREKQMPQVLQEAKKNLHNPPKIYTEIALEQMPDIIGFFQNDVPAAFKQVTDAALKKEFEQTNNKVIEALKSYQQWMQTDLLPRSHGDFRIGVDNFRKKLQYDEMVDLPLPQLLAIDRANMKANQNAYKAILKELATNGTPQQVKKSLDADHPAPDALLTSFSSTFDSLIAFIKDKKIIKIPSTVQPIMESTPPFLRATTFASMDTPGPFEKKATEAFFNVTLPEKSWDQAKVNDYMASFNYPAINAIAIHEAYPGHYVQFLWMHDVTDRVRKILGASSNAEGWAHYCEQMMLDEGYGQSGNTREAKLLRLGQLQNALLRNARFIVGIEMHTGKMTTDQAVEFFVKEGYQPRTSAVIEMRRGTSDPTYLYYTLGKLQILKLRHDLEVKEGAAFNLEKFHDDFMRQGFPPIKIVRRALLGNDSPTL